MDDSILVPFAFRITKDLGPFLLATTEDTLSLVLETLSSVLDIGKSSWVTAELAEQIVAATLQVWINNNKGEYISQCFCNTYTHYREILHRSDFDFYSYGNIYFLVEITPRNLPSSRKRSTSHTMQRDRYCKTN